MDKERRRLIQAGLLGGAATMAGVAPGIGKAQEAGPAPVKSQRILILGGTGFIGPHMVREALRRGHSVTLFNRGRTKADLFPDLELLLGDRNNDLKSLENGSWDAVIDNSGYVPRHVSDSAKLLAGRVSHYVYVSTISVYASYETPNDESSPLATIADESVEEITGETYGSLKALCEQRVAEEMGADRMTVLRPTYICGPGDTTDRFTYWPIRTMRGGEMIWPGTPGDPIQIIDVRDFANFAVDCAEKRIAGTYNAATPAGSFTMGQLQDDCLAVSAADMTPVNVDGDWLNKHDLAQGRSIPIWAPPVGEFAGLPFTNAERAVANGLHNRPPRETTRDTISWWRNLPAERQTSMKAGLSAEGEMELLAKWKKAKRNFVSG